MKERLQEKNTDFFFNIYFGQVYAFFLELALRASLREDLNRVLHLNIKVKVLK